MVSLFGKKPASLSQIWLYFQRILLMLALALFLIPIMPIVHAQTTNIMNVSYPKHATFDLESRTTDPPLLLEATVTYADAKPGYFLALGVFDLDSGDIVGGSGTASNGACDAGYARCLIDIKSSTGNEFVQFLLEGYKPTMSMTIIAVLYNETKNLIYHSESDYEFTITMTATLGLSVIVPGSVRVAVDGIEQPKGNVRLNLVPGTHTISVPEIVQLDNVTRLKFQHWSDAINQTSRSVSLTYRTLLTAVYVNQYWLDAASPHGNSTGSGWYDEGSSATFSVQSTTLPMENVLGLLGGKWIFKGWYDGGELLTMSSASNIVMLGPHSLIARWTNDYSLPLVSFSAVTIAVLAMVRVVKRRASAQATLQTPRRGRRRSGA